MLGQKYIFVGIAFGSSLLLFSLKMPLSAFNK